MQSVASFASNGAPESSGNAARALFSALVEKHHEEYTREKTQNEMPLRQRVESPILSNQRQVHQVPDEELERQIPNDFETLVSRL